MLHISLSILKLQWRNCGGGQGGHCPPEMFVEGRKNHFGQGQGFDYGE